MKHIVVLVALIGLLPVSAAPKEMPAAGRRDARPSVALGPNYPVPADPELGALQTDLRAALDQGDRVRARAIDEQIQSLLLARQPRPECHLPPPKVSFVPPSRTPMVDLRPDVLIHSGRIMAFAVDHLSDGQMWAVCARDDSADLVFISNDHGETWEFLFSFRLYFAPTRAGPGWWQPSSRSARKR